MNGLYTSLTPTREFHFQPLTTDCAKHAHQTVDTMPAVRESVLLAQQHLAEDAMSLKTVDATTRSLNIVDIQNPRAEINLKGEILAQMSPEQGPRTLPTLLLYDERGLQLFEDVCPCFPQGFPLCPVLERHVALQLCNPSDARSHIWTSTT